MIKQRLDIHTGEIELVDGHLCSFGPEVVAAIATAAPYVSAAGTALQVVGTIKQGQAANAQGIVQQQAADYDAKVLGDKANTEAGIAQRNAAEETRRANIVRSNLQANAAAGGGTATDPGIIDLAGDIAAEGELRSMMALATGEARSQDLKTSATLRTYEGANAALAGRQRASNAYLSAFDTGLQGAGTSLYLKYGAGGAPGGKTAGWLDPDKYPTYG